jgi:hypothetical protein
MGISAKRITGSAFWIAVRSTAVAWLNGPKVPNVPNAPTVAA